MEKHIPCCTRALRLRYWISLAELAEAAGISPQLLCKIELEPRRQTSGHEKRLKRAFALLIDHRRARLDALETELAGCGGLFQPTEGDEYGI